MNVGEMIDGLSEFPRSTLVVIPYDIEGMDTFVPAESIRYGSFKAYKDWEGEFDEDSKVKNAVRIWTEE